MDKSVLFSRSYEPKDKKSLRIVKSSDAQGKDLKIKGVDKRYIKDWSYAGDVVNNVPNHYDLKDFKGTFLGLLGLDVNVGLRVRLPFFIFEFGTSDYETLMKLVASELGLYYRRYYEVKGCRVNNGLIFTSTEEIFNSIF